MEENTTTTEAQEEVSIEQRVQSDIQKFNVTDAAIAELNAQYSSLTIKDVNDKEGYKKVTEARKDIKKKRTSVESMRKALVEGAVKYQQGVNGEAKRITKLLLEIENPLQEKEAFYEAEHERIRKEKEREEQEKIQNRVNQLYSLGLAFNGNEYSIGDTSIDSLAVKVYSDEQFNEFIEKAQVEFLKEQSRKAEEERKDKLRKQRALELAQFGSVSSEDLGEMPDEEWNKLFDNAKGTFLERERAKREEEERLEKIRQEQEAERQRMNAEKKANEEKAAQLKAEQERIEEEKLAIEREKQKLELDKLMSRKNDLLNLGFELNQDGSLSYEELAVSSSDLKLFTDKEWPITIKNFSEIIKERKRIEAERLAKEEEEKAKLAAEEKARLDDEEKQRQELLRPDKEKLLAVAESLENFQFPTVSSDNAMFILHNVQDELKTISEYIRKELKSI